MTIQTSYRDLVLSISILFVALSASSQSRQLDGVVLDKATNNPIPYATVILKNSENEFLVGTSTNENGFYLLEYKDGKL